MLCANCHREINSDWAFCPSCGGIQTIRAAVVELLRRSTGPIKAKELATLLSSKLNRDVTRREVNQTLYPLMGEGMAQINAEFRWSLLPSNPNHQNETQAIIVSPAAPAPKTECLSGPEGTIGHWRFEFESDPATTWKWWMCSCSLCGRQETNGFLEETGSVRSFRRLRAQRIAHDKKKHPDEVAIQIEVEEIRLTFAWEDDPVARELSYFSFQGAEVGRPRDTLPMRVDTFMKQSFGRRLVNGFALMAERVTEILPDDA